MNYQPRNKPPRIVYVCHEFPKFTETFVYREVAELLRRGVDVEVIAMKKPAGLENIDGVERLERITRYLPPDFSAGFMAAQARWIFTKPRAYLRELMAVLRPDCDPPDALLKVRAGIFMRGVVAASMLQGEGGTVVMQVPGTGHELIAAHAAHALTGIPYGFTLHAPFALYSNSRLLATHARDAAWIASISKDARERIVDLAGEATRTKVGIVHCGVDWVKYEAGGARTGNVIASVASLVDFKGHDLLIRAVSILNGRGVDVSLEIAGSGPRREYLESLARELGVQDKVKLLGGIHPREVTELLGRAAVFSLASRVDSRGARDGVPVALMEAMASGLPCVSIKVSGIPELIEDGVSGLLTGPDDPDALADAFERIFRDDELAAELGRNARKRIEEQYNLDGQVDGLLALIEKNIRPE